VIDEQASRLRKQVKAFYRRLRRELPTALGLSQTLVSMLGLVGKSPDGVRPGELAGELQMTDSNVAAALRTLEARGLIVRSGDPTDGRKVLVSCTPLGAKTAHEARQIHYAWLRTTIEALLTKEEQHVLLAAGDLMQRLTEHAVASEPGQLPGPKPRDGQAQHARPTRSSASPRRPRRAPAPAAG
jgi:DNA-binding MarR family transcriptional regulator